MNKTIELVLTALCIIICGLLLISMLPTFFG